MVDGFFSCALKILLSRSHLPCGFENGWNDQKAKQLSKKGNLRVFDCSVQRGCGNSGMVACLSGQLCGGDSELLHLMAVAGVPVVEILGPNAI